MDAQIAHISTVMSKRKIAGFSAKVNTRRSRFNAKSATGHCDFYSKVRREKTRKGEMFNDHSYLHVTGCNTEQEERTGERQAGAQGKAL